MTNTRTIPAAPAAVWDALNDPDALKACLPGCESLERVDDTSWKAVMAAKVGPVSARFAGTMRITESNPPTGYTLRFEGQGGAAGFANGEAQVTLTPADGEATELRYHVKAQVGGKLAQIGSRLIDGAAAKIADDFFARFSERLAPAAIEAEAAMVPVAAGRAPASKPWIRYVSLAAIIAIIVYLALRGFR
ncbi:MAG: carbon monoxide dehydrogenase subunit G [Burkholderiales bacterium]